MSRISPLRKRQFIGGVIGVIIGVLLFFVLTLESTEDYVSVGHFNTGHEELSCYTCHADAPGNLMQQIQSNIAYVFGARKEPVDFGTEDVTAKNCMECHDRPNDRHPIYRFEEPRFRDAVKAIDATTCITCHTEHHGERVSVQSINYCMNCHQDLVVEEDPLDVDHETLIANEEWSTCIQCHDFHGNHKYEVPEKLKDTIPMKKIEAYFDGGDDPYGAQKKYLGLSQEEWLKELGVK